jgi:hypothetical protein
MIWALPSLPSTSFRRPSIKPWRSLAASYSAFSERSPCERASAIGGDDRRAIDRLQALQFDAQEFRTAQGDGELATHVAASR